MKGKLVWLPSTFDIGYLYTRCVPDSPAKGNVSDTKLSAEGLGVIDVFGIEWEYVPQVGGSTIRPGDPLLDDASEWKEKVVFLAKAALDIIEKGPRHKLAADKKAAIDAIMERIVAERG